jgi:hypothetical protein
MRHTLDMRRRPKLINSVSVTLGLTCLILGYAGWFFLPEFWPVFQVTGIMRDIANRSYRTVEDEDLMAMLLKETEHVKLPLSRDNFRLERIPWEMGELLELGPSTNSNDVWIRRGKGMVVQFHYQGKAKWPLLDRYTQLTFDRDVSISYEEKIREGSEIKKPGCNCDKSFSLF